MSATPENAICKGNAFLYGGRLGVQVTTANLTKRGTLPATGLTTLTGFLATAKGGAALADTTLPLVEYADTPGTYNVALDVAVVNVVIVGQSTLWLALQLPDGLLSWTPVPVVQDRTTA